METLKVAKTTDKVETGDDDSLNHVPNAVTLAAMQETEDMISGKIPCAWYQSPEELIDALKDEIKR
jgi:hypothetical protein